MSIDFHSTERPNYPQPRFTRKAAMAIVAVLISSTLLVGMLSMFETRSEEAAMARASVKTQPSTDGLAVRKWDYRPFVRRAVRQLDCGLLRAGTQEFAFMLEIVSPNLDTSRERVTVLGPGRNHSQVHD